MIQLDFRSRNRTKKIRLRLPVLLGIRLHPKPFDSGSATLVLIIIHDIWFYSTFVVITPESSNEFPWISIWRLVKSHSNYCVDVFKARWLRPAFAESYRLLRVTLPRELVAVHVWNAPDQWHDWRVARVRTALPHCQAQSKNRAPT